MPLHGNGIDPRRGDVIPFPTERADGERTQSQRNATPLNYGGFNFNFGSLERSLPSPPYESKLKVVCWEPHSYATEKQQRLASFAKRKLSFGGRIGLGENGAILYPRYFQSSPPRTTIQWQSCKTKLANSPSDSVKSDLTHIIDRINSSEGW